MANKNNLFNHRRFFNKPEQRRIMPKTEITSGMIVFFRYPARDKRPLVFVMDTDEFKAPDKRTFSGINLNYMPVGEVNRFFIKVLEKAPWEYSRITKMPKVDIWDEENPGIRPNIIYNNIVKREMLNRRDCWRTYKYKKSTLVEQVNFRFTSPPLNLLTEGDGNLKKISKSEMHKRLSESRYGKTKGKKDED